MPKPAPGPEPDAKEFRNWCALQWLTRIRECGKGAVAGVTAMAVTAMNTGLKSLTNGSSDIR